MRLGVPYSECPTPYSCVFCSKYPTWNSIFIRHTYMGQRIQARIYCYSDQGIRSRTCSCTELSKVRNSYSECPTLNIATIRRPLRIKSYSGWNNGKKVNVLCIVNQNHDQYVVVLDNLRNFKDIELIVENEEGILLIQGKGKYCSNLRTRKLKTKKVVKNYRCYIRRRRALSTISRQNQSSASLKLRKYVFSYQNLESGCLLA